MRIILLLIATLLVAPTDVLAQQQRPQLQIVVERLDEDAEKCGVREGQLESIAALTLRNNGIQTVSERTNPYLHVSVTFLPTTAGGCAFSTHVAVMGFSQSDDAKRPIGAFKKRKSLTQTELCEQGNLSLSSQVRVATNMTQVLENLIKQCLGQLDY